MGDPTKKIVRAVSASAPLVHRAPTFVLPTAADFSLAQRIARYGLTLLAITAMSALFATQVAATMH